MSKGVGDIFQAGTINVDKMDFRLLGMCERFVGALAQCRELGIHPVYAGNNALVLELPYTQQIVGNPEDGVIHGGGITTLMDTASGTVIMCALPEFELCPTLDLRVDYMRPAVPGKPVYARATAYRVTHNIIFTRCEAYQLATQSDGRVTEKQIAHCVATFMRIGRENTPADFNSLVSNETGTLSTDVNSRVSVQQDVAPICSEGSINLRGVVERAHQSGDYTEFMGLIPYAQTIGAQCQRFGDDVIFKLPQKASNIGNPILPAIHGGVIGGFMEISAALYLAMFQPTPKLPRIVDFSIDYLRAGLDKDTFVECQLTRQGNRVANVIINAWQQSREKPIATSRAHFIFD